MKSTLLKLVMALVDGLMAVIPRAVPDRPALERCRIISHRGEHDDSVIRENTLPAFANARAAGVWGIECDIRWTADLVPVICHDPTANRVFGRDIAVADLPLARLREQIPDIPILGEVIEEFGGNTHLMLELKADGGEAVRHKREALREHLAPLTPSEDFHILALDAALFELVDFLPPGCCLPVAETNSASMSRIALQRGYAGLGGHYLLLDDGIKRRHDALGQRLGTGFPRSRNCLFRELNRGIEWVFSNDAVLLQEILEQHLRASED